ncbi:uncharacterized protein (DUF305 family) [Labedaea rhizosphaerae]|uniref:Uncharacterized protein (DUF305 family) n=2 Tax=Labedaea rhizosphaerae TaxID=598644 RepID=A0A4R6SDJ0_LABRH|nr:uncharacterized protein (DUF305 family) [Labedaea rhizosphaerae]
MVHPDDDEVDEVVEVVEEPQAAEDDGHGAPSAQRALVFAAAALAVLLVGAAIGMLITRATIDEPSVPTAGSVDVGFAQDMAVHHTQAVTMATIELGRSSDPEVRNLAFDIQTSQQNQVGQMNGFLAVWNQPLFGSGTYMKWMAGPAGHGGMGGMDMSADGVKKMPGMATTAELTKLRTLSGKELDVYFLQLMIRHHEGGAPMAQYALDHAQTDAVRTLADSIIKTQGAEVTTMTEMLAARGAKPLPAP